METCENQKATGKSNSLALTVSWHKVVDQTVTSGTNGLRMPYCDKAQRPVPKVVVGRRKESNLLPHEID